jgi:hypothetical protein
MMNEENTSTRRILILRSGGTEGGWETKRWVFRQIDETKNSCECVPKNKVFLFPCLENNTVLLDSSMKSEILTFKGA